MGVSGSGAGRGLVSVWRKSDKTVRVFPRKFWASGGCMPAIVSLGISDHFVIVFIDQDELLSSLRKNCPCIICPRRRVRDIIVMTEHEYCDRCLRDIQMVDHIFPIFRSLRHDVLGSGSVTRWRYRNNGRDVQRYFRNFEGLDRMPGTA